jgi:hypothetical protein
MIPPRTYPIGRTVLLIALAWLAFTWPWLTGSVTIPWDAKAHFYPQLVFLARTLAGGESPFWTGNVFSGHPQIADPQSLIFSPPFLLLAALMREPSFVAADAVTFAMLGLGGLAVALHFRDRGWHWSGAVVAALVFAFGASAAWRVQHIGQVVSLAWLAVAHLMLERTLARRSYGYAVATAVTAAFMLLGRDQIALLGAYLLVGRVLVHWLAGPRRLRRIVASLPRLGLCGVVGLAIVAVPLAMSALFGASSNRPEIDLVGAGRGSLHPVHLLTLFVADLFGSSGPMAEVWGPPSFAWPDTGIFLAQNMFVLYVGAIPLVLIVVGLTRGVLLSREIVGVTVATAVVLAYALGWYTPLFRLAYEVLPGISLFRRPADATFLFGALCGVLAGYVLHRLMTGTLPAARPWQRLVEIGLVGGGAAATLALAVLFDRATDKAFVPLVTGAVCLAVALLALLLAARLGAARPRLVALVLVALVAADLTWSNGPTPSTAMPPDDYDVLRPSSTDPVIALLTERVRGEATDVRRDRIELLGLGFHWPNASLVHDLDHTLGYNPLRLGIYSAATGAIDTIGLPDQRRFPPLFPSYRSRLADLLGLRFIVSPEPIEAIDRNLPPGSLALIGRPGGRYLYENPGALPRVALPAGAVAADTAALIATGRWPEVDPERTVVLERTPPGAPVDGAPGQARIVLATNTETVVEAFAPAGGGFVVLRDPWHPWWFADVDGVPADILRADVLFRAVRVPEGQSRVRFVFRPVAGVLREVRARLGRW